MDGGVTKVECAVRHLRVAHAETLSRLSQSEVVSRLVRLADLWRDPLYPPRRRAERLTEPFPFAMARVSLKGLLDSLTADALAALIDADDVRERSGVPVVGHIIAGNTPLLAWTSVLRALLMRSASFVKLPSGPAAEWGRLFADSLEDVCPALAQCVSWAEWPGGTPDLDAALCRTVDLVLAYGSNATLRQISALCPPATPLVGYGHRVSFGLVTAPVCDAGVSGFAADVLLYDQGGCLSPQVIFVRGDWPQARAFAERLATALPAVAAQFPLPFRAKEAATRVREARLLAQMEERTQVWGDRELRWTVVARPVPDFTPSPTHGVISVQPLPSEDALADALWPVASFLQGCAVAPAPDPRQTRWLWELGISYVCAPGRLQSPPLSWREDNHDVLRSLLPPPKSSERPASESDGSQ